MHVLKDDLEMVGIYIADAELMINNVSTDLLTGARLKRINTTANDLKVTSV